MLPVSTDFLRAIKASQNRNLTLGVQVPDTFTGVLGSPIPFEVSDGQVTAAYTNGQRYGATLNITPDDRRAWADLLLTEGAVFTVGMNVRTVGNTYEGVSLFTGELSAAPTVSVYGGAFQLTCQDQWVRLDRCRYTSPYTTPNASRSSIISSRVTLAIPTATVVVGGAVSGTHPGGLVYDKDRTTTITDLAAETSPDLSVGFTAEGKFEIDVQPTIDLASAVYAIADGEDGTLVDFQKVRQSGRPFNTVVVRPAQNGQTWSPQVVVEISDVTHPRHKSKIGVVPYFMVAPTTTTRTTAVNVGLQRLAAILQQQYSGRVVAVDNPALEPGDVISVTMTTGPSAGQIIPCMVTNISRSLLAGSMELEIQRYADTDLAEAP